MLSLLTLTRSFDRRRGQGRVRRAMMLEDRLFSPGEQFLESLMRRQMTFEMQQRQCRPLDPDTKVGAFAFKLARLE